MGTMISDQGMKPDPDKLAAPPSTYWHVKVPFKVLRKPELRNPALYNAYPGSGSLHLAKSPGTSL